MGAEYLIASLPNTHPVAGILGISWDVLTSWILGIDICVYLTVGTKSGYSLSKVRWLLWPKHLLNVYTDYTTFPWTHMEVDWASLLDLFLHSEKRYQQFGMWQNLWQTHKFTMNSGMAGVWCGWRIARRGWKIWLAGRWTWHVVQSLGLFSKELLQDFNQKIALDS